MRHLIKNMVSIRCKMIVRAELEKLGYQGVVVELGEVELNEKLSPDEYKRFKMALLAHGLEVLEDKKSKIIEKIKNIIVEMVHYSDEEPIINFSQHLSEKLHYDYKYLSHLFSAVKGTTIERYMIAHKIERAKELLIYDELTLTEVAHKLHYSSVAHLSAQFKKVTGLTPSFFKKMRHKPFTNLEDL